MVAYKVIIVDERLKTVALKLGEIKGRIESLIEVDPQYKAVKRLVSEKGINLAALLIVSNSLISYQLSITGEEYWTLFSQYFSNIVNPLSIESFRDFLFKTGCLRNLEQKIKRIEKILASPLADKLLENGLYFCNDMSSLVNTLQRVLDTRGDSKTLVFTAKMYGYLCIANHVKPSWMNIPIPVDYRNALLSLTSCIVKYDEAIDLRRKARELTKNPYSSILQRAWKRICEESGIPCLEIDVFTWLFTRVALEADLDPKLTAMLIREKYGFDISLDLSNTLLECVSKNV